jgi:hypothetical protein
VDELDLAPLGGGGHQVTADLADPGLQVGDDPALETVGQRAADLGVAGRVHRQEHEAHHLQLALREVLQDHAAGAGRVERRVAGDVHHVGVVEDGEEAGLAVHLLPGHRRGGPELGQQVVRGTVEEDVGVGERGHQPTSTFGRSKPSASHRA